MNYTIIAGVNGAGKSVFYHSEETDYSVLGIRVNVDELIEREYGNKWNDFKIQMKASREIIAKINNCLSKGLDFNQETTLSGKSIINTVKKAKNLGYTINLHYIGIESPELAIKRVKGRVEQGGHGIPEETICKRFYKSLENLQEVLTLCDNVYIYDNSIIKRNLVIIENGEIKFKSHIPEYMKKYLEDYIMNISDKTKDIAIEDEWDLEI